MVTPELTARAVGSGDLDVFATPMLIALLEEAACSALDGALPDGSTSVGTHVDVRHRGPSPVGTTVTGLATVTDVDGARIGFDVAAWQDVDDQRITVATGRHTRVVVDRTTFAS